MRSSLIAATALTGILAASFAHAACPSLNAALSLATGCDAGTTAPPSAPSPSWTADPASLMPLTVATPGEIFIVSYTGEEWQFQNGAWVDTGLTLATTNPTTHDFQSSVGVPSTSMGSIGDVDVTSVGEIWIKTAATVWTDSGYAMTGLQGNSAASLPPSPYAYPGYLAPNSTGYAMAPATVANDADSSGLLDSVACLLASSYSPTSTVPLIGRWENTSGGLNSNLLSIVSGGDLAQYVYIPAGTDTQVTSTATVASAMSPPQDGVCVRSVANLGATQAYGGVNATATSFPGGSVTFYTAPVGTTATATGWTQLGSTITGLTTTGIRLEGAVSSSDLFVGNVTNTTALPGEQLFYGYQATTDKVIINENFNAVSNGATTFTDTAPTANTFSVVSPAVVQ